jgi:hypothetical protein
MMTFSLNNGTIEEAVSYPLKGTTYSFVSDNYIDYVLDKLKDNKSKEIQPFDLRDTFLSLYSSSPIKETSLGASLSYIGLDSLNPSYRGITSSSATNSLPFLIGKSLYNGIELMSNTLSSDIDIFLYNTKPDSNGVQNTKLSILAGTAISNFLNAPYFESSMFINPGYGNTIALNVYNRYSDINITSNNGTVSVASIPFPTIAESSASASNNSTLMWEDGKLAWSQISIPLVSFLGETHSLINIQGSPVNVNSYPLEFKDDRLIPLTFNDVIVGEKFESYTPIEDVLRRMVYPYLSPACSISLQPPYDNGYVEVGTYPNPKLNWTIIKKSLPTQITGLSNMIPGASPAITQLGQTFVNGVSDGVVVSPVLSETTEFRITVTDGTSTSTASAYLTGIYPFFYGFSSFSSITNVGLGSLTKLVEFKSDKNIDITGSGNLYFIYDYDYGTLSNIYDQYGNTCSASFSHSSQSFSSPTGLWAGKTFYVYKWSSASQIGPPSENFTFVF